MSEQLELFSKPDQNYKVVRYFGKMTDTNGSEIYFVKTVKNRLTKYSAEEFCNQMNNKIYHDTSEYFEVTK